MRQLFTRSYIKLFGKSCEDIRPDFSAYLDGAVSGRTMQSIAAHLKSCPSCATDFEEWRATQRAVASLGAVKPPADLSLRLRLAISRESARRRNRWTDRFALQWENILGPVVLQATGGLAAAILLMGTIITMLGVTPQAVLANDEPLGAVTVPHYLHSGPAVGPIHTPGDQVIVVAVDVNTRGEVYDYHILSGPLDSDTRDQVVQRLALSVFQPASVFGEPVNGHAVLTFTGISVKG
jgi:anti-sigma factor RsiW